MTATGSRSRTASGGGAAAEGLIEPGSAALRRLDVAMVAAGLAGFSLLYATQALLPDVGRTFGVGATAASLTVSVATGALALSVLPVSRLAERVGRTRIMTLGLGVAFVSVLAGAVAPAFWFLLLTRAVDGIALAGVIAVAMGHIGASVQPQGAGTAIGVYVSGTSVGGLLGRLIPAAVSEGASWRWSMTVLALVAAACTLVFARLVPPHRPTAAARAPGNARRELGLLVRTPGLLRLCVVPLLLMGGFVATYNYLSYRLVAHPFDLSASSAGFVFAAYLTGTVTSTAAARLARRFGRRQVVLTSIVVALAGLALTLFDSLPAVLVGLVIFTAGYFGAHGTASGWASALAPGARSTASALYVMAYYLGSSTGGTLIGFAWDGGGWGATVTAVAACYVGAALAAVGVGRGPAQTVGVSASKAGIGSTS